MPEGDREDIWDTDLRFSCISLISNRVRVIIIGGGRAGLIKCRSFLKKGCRVWVLSREFCSGFEGLGGAILIKGEYQRCHIEDKHLVVIATDDEEVNDRIAEDCESMAKLYLHCGSFKKGCFVMPVQRETKTLCFSINTKTGSPGTSRYIADELKESLEGFDSFAEYLSSLRDRVRKDTKKDEIMAFAASRDFHFFYQRKKHEVVLNMFYGGNW